MQKGDRLILYTDGLTEQKNRQEEIWSEKKLQRWLQEYSGNTSSDLEKLHADLMKEWDLYRNGQPVIDDISLVCLEVKKTSRGLLPFHILQKGSR